MIKSRSMVTKVALFGVASLMFSFSIATVGSASLIFLDDYDATAEGFGAVDNILTMHNTSVTGGAGDAGDIEEGKVAWNGTSDVITGTWASTDPNKTATFTFGYLGIEDASQIIFVWDPAEIGSTAGEETHVDMLEMTIYDALGNSVWDASLEDPVIHLTVDNPGVGGGDFTYGLDDEQAAALNTTLAGIGDFSLYRIGLESEVSYIDDGPNTWLIGRGPANPVPEPTTMLLFGTGLAGLAGYLRRKNKK